MDTFGGASMNKDFEQSPVLLSPGGMAEIKHAARLLYLILDTLFTVLCNFCSRTKYIHIYLHVNGRAFTGYNLQV